MLKTALIQALCSTQFFTYIWIWALGYILDLALLLTISKGERGTLAELTRRAHFEWHVFRCILQAGEGGPPSVEVALVDERGRELDGYGLAASRVRSRDGAVSWVVAGDAAAERREVGMTPRHGQGVRLRLRFGGNAPVTLYALYCAMSSGAQRAERRRQRRAVAEERASALLSDSVAAPVPQLDYYRHDFTGFLESESHRVAHAFWHGRRVQAVYALDREFIVAESVRGRVEVRLARPVRPLYANRSAYESESLALTVNDSVRAIYPALVDTALLGLQEDAAACGQSEEQYPVRTGLIDHCLDTA